MNHTRVWLLCGLLGMALTGCSDAPVVSNAPATNANSQGANAKPKPANTETPASSPKPASGTAIDTAKLDEDIARAEKEVQRKPKDEAARTALAHAYLARAGALTKAQQYRAALGDYRRTLRYDPDNADAREMSGTIVSILQKMGRDVPVEGEEPAPLPFKKGTQEADSKGPQKSY